MSSMGTSYVYMKVLASPSWKRVKVIVTKTGDNFLLSHAELKNLGLLSANFPEYIGEIRRAHVQSTQREEELANAEYGYFPSTMGDDETATEEDDVTINQGESAITIEYPKDLSDVQVTEVEAYAALFAIGGYTYDNLVQEPPDEVCNSAEKDDKETDSEHDEEDDGIDADTKVDEEELIGKKSPYK